MAILEPDARRKISDLKRRQGVREVAPETLAQWALLAHRTPDGHLHCRVEQGSEEHQALDVIEMEVRQQNVHLSSPACERQT
jgi:hypothetical protein